MGYPFQSGTGGDIASVTPHEWAALDATPCEAAHATVWRGSGSRAWLPTTLAIPRGTWLTPRDLTQMHNPLTR
jgi:hypothetical protein